MLKKVLKYRRAILFSSIALSILAKLLVGFFISDSFFSRGNNYHTLNSLAKHIMTYREYSIVHGIPSVDYEPLYPVLLALCYSVFGFNWLGVTLIQAVLASMTTICMFYIGRRVVNNVVGIVAAVYQAFYPYLFTQTLSVIDTTLFTFLVIFLICLILHLKRSNRIHVYFFVGIVSGLAILTRSSIFALFPPIFIYLVIRLSNIELLKGITGITVGICCITAPWLVRNYQYTNSIIISVHGSFGLWQGNNMLTYRYLSRNISLDEIYRLNPPPDIIQRYPIAARPPMQAILVADNFKNEAKQFALNNPSEFIKLFVLKIWKFLSPIRNPTRPTSDSTSDDKLMQYFYFFSYLPLIVFFPFGACSILKRSLPYFLLLFFVIFFYTLAHGVVMGHTRLRLPIEPIFILFFSSGLYHVITRPRSTLLS